ncbi:hypothetical protein HA073_29340 [Micromonospora sp. CMU55-4]|nr:hypothetical protein [Micromonospora sp. CMU55-4]
MSRRSASPRRKSTGYDVLPYPTIVASAARSATATVDRLAPYCKPCASQRSSLARYGLTRERCQQILAEQNEGCAICGQPPGDKALVIDHDHSCRPGRRSCGKCVRGLLCGPCNCGVGMLREARSCSRRQSSTSLADGCVRRPRPPRRGRPWDTVSGSASRRTTCACAA